jgi:YD repeat-containing protein
VGNLEEITHPDGTTLRWTYESFTTPTSYTNQLGQQTLYTLDPASGNVVGVRQVVGQPDDSSNGESDDPFTAFTYTAEPSLPDDAPAGLLATETDPSGRVTSYQYNSAGKVTKITSAAGTVDETSVQYEYDSAGNRTAVIDELGRRTQFTYDADANLTSVTLPDPDGDGPLAAPVTSYVYNSLGRLSVAIDPSGRETRYIYNNVGDVVRIETSEQHDSSNPIVTSTRYNADSLPTRSVDALGRVTTYVYNDLKLPSSVTLPDPDNSGPLAAPVMQYSYDLLGRTTQIVDPLGNVTRYTYENFGRRIITTLPDPDGAHQHHRSARSPHELPVRCTGTAGHNRSARSGRQRTAGGGRDNVCVRCRRQLGQRHRRAEPHHDVHVRFVGVANVRDRSAQWRR